MKRCDFCEYNTRVDSGDKICTKHSFCVGAVEKDFPCDDFLPSQRLKAWVMLLSFALAVIVGLILGSS